MNVSSSPFLLIFLDEFLYEIFKIIIILDYALDRVNKHGSSLNIATFYIDFYTDWVKKLALTRKTYLFQSKKRKKKKKKDSHSCASQ